MCEIQTNFKSLKFLHIKGKKMENYNLFTYIINLNFITEYLYKIKQL